MKLRLSGSTLMPNPKSCTKLLQLQLPTSRNLKRYETDKIIIHNLSRKLLSKAVVKAIEKGLNFAVALVEIRHHQMKQKTTRQEIPMQIF